MNCPDNHKHGLTHTCYSTHGCRCDDCRTSKRRRRSGYDRRAREMRGMDVYVPVTGTRRRLQALAVMGWSSYEISRLTGLHARPVGKIRENRTHYARLHTARVVAEFFHDHALTRRDDRAGRITSTKAIQAGWVGPFAWDNIDNPRERPKGQTRRTA